jgi:hypothetical protein
MVETQILNNRNGYYKQYVVTDNDYVVIVTTDMSMADSIEQEIKQKEKNGHTKDRE